MRLGQEIPTQNRIHAIVGNLAHGKSLITILARYLRCVPRRFRLIMEVGFLDSFLTCMSKDIRQRTTKMVTSSHLVWELGQPIVEPRCL